MNLQNVITPLFIGVLLCVGFILLDDDVRASQYSEALSSYQRAIKTYDSSSIKNAISHFDAIIASDPTDGRALVYKGSLLSALAKASWMPWDKLGYVNKGIDLMDQGITMVSTKNTDSHTEIEVRMVRGITSAKIPSAFRRGQVAEADFKMIREHPNFSKMSADDKCAVFAYSAVLAGRAGEINKADLFLREAQTFNGALANTIWSQK